MPCCGAARLLLKNKIEATNVTSMSEKQQASEGGGGSDWAEQRVAMDPAALTLKSRDQRDQGRERGQPPLTGSGG